MTRRELNVWINARLIGRISEGDDLWEFAYEPDWAKASDGFARGVRRAHIDRPRALRTMSTAASKPVASTSV